MVTLFKLKVQYILVLSWFQILKSRRKVQLQLVIQYPLMRKGAKGDIVMLCHMSLQVQAQAM